MSKSSDSIAAREQVYKQLRSRFPKDAIEWVRLVQWDPCTKVDLDQFNTSDEKSWAAYRSPDHVQQEIEQYEQGENAPIIGVQGPGKDALIDIIDGHHRFLARQRMGKSRIRVYVGRVPSDEGPWSYTHLSQRGGDSG